jgi:predicted transglutaminase-like cysteine proteinase
MTRFQLPPVLVSRSQFVIDAVPWRHFRPALVLSVFVLLAGLAIEAMAWDFDRLRLSAARQGGAAVEAVRALTETVNNAAHLDDEGRLQLLNQFFNRRVAFRDDLEVWGQIDYWATPLEMLTKGEGDCEDYAIAKYFSLMAAGIPSARMRLVYVKATLGGTQQAHMVLAYYGSVGAVDPLILDNLVGDIRPASRRPDLLPVFSFNIDGLWSGTQGPGAGDPVSRLSRWRDLLARAREQGFL